VSYIFHLVTLPISLPNHYGMNHSIIRAT
jgi:hypothetical protein